MKFPGVEAGGGERLTFGDLSESDKDDRASGVQGIQGVTQGSDRGTQLCQARQGASKSNEQPRSERSWALQGRGAVGLVGRGEETGPGPARPR